MLGPRRRGHLLAAALQPPRKERPAAGVPVSASARRELTRLGQPLLSRGLEPRRGVARGPPVGVAGGELFFLWGKPFSMLWLLPSCSSAFPHMPIFSQAKADPRAGPAVHGKEAQNGSRLQGIRFVVYFWDL